MISRFDNGHYRPAKVWVPYDGYDYLVRFEGDNAISVKGRYVREHNEDEGWVPHDTRPVAIYRSLNINGPRAKAVVKVAQKIRTGEIVV